MNNIEIGDAVSATVEIPLTRGKVTIIDKADLDSVKRWTWHAQWGGLGKSWYARNDKDVNGKRVATWMHRVIIGAPMHLRVDHRNGNGLDNRRDNLRVATDLQNAANRRGRVMILSTHGRVHHRDWSEVKKV